MIKILLSPLASALLLAACQAEDVSDNQAQAAAAADATTGPVAPAEAKKVEEKTAELEFTYSWPAEAAAIPTLNKQLEEELGRDRIEALATARDDKGGRTQDKTDFFAHSFSKQWQLTGNTPRLLSIVAEVSTFTGGLHPNTDYDGVMWDREAGREVALADLFVNGGALVALGKGYCRGLDALRLEKRGEEIEAPEGDFMTACPPIGDQTIIAADTNGNGSFDRLQVWIPPSVAGPNAEGDYQIDLKIDSATLAALKPEYRTSFES